MSNRKSANMKAAAKARKALARTTDIDKPDEAKAQRKRLATKAAPAPDQRRF